MRCTSLREHRKHQCGEVRRRIPHWQKRVAEHVHAEGVAWHRITITWGGVRNKSKSREENIVWCHPSKGVELVENGTTEVEVWPVWLGLGPVAGTVVAMMRQGIQSPARLIYKVLTDLATITQVRSSSDLCYTEISEMRMGFQQTGRQVAIPELSLGGKKVKNGMIDGSQPPSFGCVRRCWRTWTCPQ